MSLQLADELEPVGHCCPPVSYWRCALLYLLGVLGLAFLGVSCGAVAGLTHAAYERTLDATRRG